MLFLVNKLDYIFPGCFPLINFPLASNSPNKSVKQVNSSREDSVPSLVLLVHRHLDRDTGLLSAFALQKPRDSFLIKV